jgi:hypothetical protein
MMFYEFKPYISKYYLVEISIKNSLTGPENNVENTHLNCGDLVGQKWKWRRHNELKYC